MIQEAEPTDPDNSADIVVIDRHGSGYRWVRRGVEETLAEDAKNAGFAHWLADPKTGRFLVLDYLEESLEFMVRNADTEAELIEVVAGKIAAQFTARRYFPSIWLYVSPDIEAKLRQMGAEIAAVINGGDPRSV